MATVGKKYTSPSKWETAWFARLSPGQKLLYCYIWDRCDHAGVLEFIPPVWSAHLGHKIGAEELKKLMEGVNQDTRRMLQLGDKIWLTEYIRFNQQPDKTKSLSADHGFHIKVVKLLKEHSLYAEAKKRDPLLLKAFEDQNGDSSTLEPSPSLGGGLPKGRSRSTSRSSSGSGSPSASKRESRQQKKDTNQLLQETDEALNGKPSLYKFKLAQELKKIIPPHVLKDVNDIALEYQVQKVLENLSNEVDDPAQCMKDRAEAIKEWDVVSYDDFFESFENGALEDVPF